jgi:hypothetical protein
MNAMTVGQRLVLVVYAVLLTVRYKKGNAVTVQHAKKVQGITVKTPRLSQKNLEKYVQMTYNAFHNSRVLKEKVIQLPDAGVQRNMLHAMQTVLKHAIPTKLHQPNLGRLLYTFRRKL